MVVTEKSVRFFLPEGFAKDATHTLTVGGVDNPRSFKPTDEFTITTYDIDGIHKIDEGYNQKLVMTIPALIVGLTNFSRGQDALSFNVSGIKNAVSTKPSSPFPTTNIVDNDGFVVSSVQGEPVIVTNRFP